VFPDNVTSKIFADDAKLYTEIKTLSDCNILQNSINLLTKWANEWQLAISLPKCNQIDFNHSNKCVPYKANTINGHVLESVCEVRDLGVIFDSKLLFTPHISLMVSKAKQRLFLILRSFRVRDHQLLLLAYKSYILPLVTYCSPVWSPSLLGDISQIESVQRLFSKRLPGLQSQPYSERLKILGLPTLELRRLRDDLLLCFKIINGLLPVKPENYGLLLSTQSTRGHCKKLFADHSRVDVRRNYFGIRVIKPWNSLPSELVTASNAYCFKKGLLKVDLNKFLKLDH